MAALGPIRSTAIDGLSEKPQFDQIHGQFFLALLPVQQLFLVAQPPMLCVSHAAIGNSFDSFNINIEEISDQDGYCCRANRNFYFIHVPVPIINHIITIHTTATILTRLPGLPDMGLYGDGPWPYIDCEVYSYHHTSRKSDIILPNLATSCRSTTVAQGALVASVMNLPQVRNLLASLDFLHLHEPFKVFKAANISKGVQVVQDGQHIQGCLGHQGSQVFKVVKVNQGDFNVQPQLMYDYLNSYQWVLALLCRRWVGFAIKSCNRYVMDSNLRAAR